jgi:uroporphyrinogen-III synthase
VLVTRPADELDDLRGALGPAGFGVLPFPVLREVVADDATGWGAVAAEVGRLHRIAFTSPRAPAALRRSAQARGMTAALGGVAAAVVGDATAAAATASGFAVAEIGTSGGAELARRVAARAGRGAIVLHACGRDHHRDLAAGLAAHDIRVIAVVVYAMELVPAGELPELPAATATAAVVLTSPRAAEAYVAALGAGIPNVPHLVMGATTAARARELGIDAVPLRRPTPAAVLEELCRICP